MCAQLFDTQTSFVPSSIEFCQEILDEGYLWGNIN
jgi:hypothetical protein